MLCPIRLISLQALKNGQDAPETSPIDLAQSRSDRAARASLLCDARSKPTGKAEADGYLVN